MDTIHQDILDTIEAFRPQTEADWADHIHAVDKCEYASGRFARFAQERGHAAALVLVHWFYEDDEGDDEGVFATEHFFVELDGEIYVDWTAAQYFDADFPVITADLDEYVERIDVALDDYGAPNVSVHPV
jgi:hypothetical protein